MEVTLIGAGNMDSAFAAPALTEPTGFGNGQRFVIRDSKRARQTASSTTLMHEFCHGNASVFRMRATLR